MNKLANDAIQRVIDDVMQTEPFSGVISLKQGERDVISKSYGYAVKRWRVPNTPETMFAIASATKMFTAVAILQLIERGLLSFQDSIVDVLQLEDSTISRKVTIEHLLTHTSGIGDYFDEDELEIDNYEDVWLQQPNYTFNSLSKFLPMFVSVKPKAKPGTIFSYNNAGYILLGLVIEKAGKQEYFQYIRENVFHAAAMLSTDFVDFRDSHRSTSEGYIPIYDGDKVVSYKRNIYSVPSAGASDGGAFTTTADMHRFLKAIRTSKLLSPVMTTEFLPQKAVEGGWSYKYGLWVKHGEDKVICYGHSGDDPGASAQVWYYPQDDVSLVVLANCSWHAIAVTRALANIIEC